MRIANISNFVCTHCNSDFEMEYSSFVIDPDSDTIIHLLSSTGKKKPIVCPECGTFHTIKF